MRSHQGFRVKSVLINWLLQFILTNNFNYVNAMQCYYQIILVYAEANKGFVFAVRWTAIKAMQQRHGYSNRVNTKQQNEQKQNKKKGKTLNTCCNVILLKES